MPQKLITKKQRKKEKNHLETLLKSENSIEYLKKSKNCRNLQQEWVGIEFDFENFHHEYDK